MNYTLVLILSASILLAAVIGWIRFNRIDPAYYPFIFCVWIASVNEIVSFFFSRYGINTAINNNIYVLIESILLAYLFKSWTVFMESSLIYYLILIIFILAWMFENVVWGSIWQIKSYFRIFYSFIIVVVSIHYNNKLFFSLTDKYTSNTAFLLCTGFIIYFTYKILIEAFWLWGSGATRNFRIKLYLLSTWINLFVNLIYAIAMLWIPRKPQHITVS